jgi:hypothetical protein
MTRHSDPRAESASAENGYLIRLREIAAFQ